MQSFDKIIVVVITDVKCVINMFDGVYLLFILSVSLHVS